MSIRLWLYGCVAALTMAHGVAESKAVAEQVSLDVSMAKPLLLADKKQTTYVKVGLTGFELKSTKERPPVNLALVLDRSGSMSGEKIERAKEAAISALERLDSRDIVSIVTYHSTVNVIVPSTKLSDREAIIRKIRNIESGGSTALFAGVSKGSDELRKFLDKERVNRVILLSDGLANVGPQSPSELGELGASLAKEGISVTTIGLGLDYHEDLMTRLASHSDGNHVFVEESTELVDVFNREFNDVLSVVAQEVVVKLRCADDVRPVRLLNTEGEITGKDVYVKVNQLYSRQEKYFILEVELPSRAGGSTMEVASVTVSYTNMKTNVDDRLSSTVSVRFSGDIAEVDEAINKPVMASCVLQLANLENAAATALRDQGKIEESKAVLGQNVRFLLENAARLDCDALKQRAEDNALQVELIQSKGQAWKRARKVMRAQQYSDANQTGDR